MGRRGRHGLIALLLVLVPGSGAQDAPPDDGGVRFEAVHVWVETGDRPLAAYQIELVASAGVRLAGIEGGSHGGFAERTFFDPRAIGGERVILAAFDNAPAEALPRGRTRLATLHVEVTGPRRADFTTNLQVAATIDGVPIDAVVSLTRGIEP